MIFIKTIITSLTVAALLLLPTTVFAASTTTGSSGETCEGLQQISPDGGDCADPDGPGVNKLIGIAINLLTIVAGVIAVIMLIVAGFKYVTSDGDAASITSAKRTLIYAIVGILVVVLAQTLVKFLLSEAV